MKNKTKSILFNINSLVEDMNQNKDNIKFDPKIEEKFKTKNLIKSEFDFKVGMPTLFGVRIWNLT
jgi:hypothetical protein